MVYELELTPPKYERVKRISWQEGKLYVLEQTNIPKTLGEKWYNWFKIVSPFAYRRVDFPRHLLLGEYIPSNEDLFILDKHGFFSLERENAVTGGELWSAMLKETIFDAYYVKVGKAHENKLYKKTGHIEEHIT